jgi:hypothetical protein
MKSNESDITVEPSRRQIQPSPREEELPELGVRVLSDFARIVAAEARLIESNLLDAAQALVDRAYVALILVVLAAVGVVALLASGALLLHHWMPWWQVMGVIGVGAVIVAEVLRRALIPAPAPKSKRSV